MKNFKIKLWILFLSLLPLFGIAQRGSGGWGPNTNYNRLFNPETIVELKGTVVSIEKITPEAGMSNGIHFLLEIDNKESISVHLGPEWYLENQDIQVIPGDLIIVKGSRIIYETKPAIIAMTVNKGENMLNLRDKRGYPNWSGWRQAGKNKGIRKRNF